MKHHASVPEAIVAGMSLGPDGITWSTNVERSGLVYISAYLATPDFLPLMFSVGFFHFVIVPLSFFDSNIHSFISASLTARC